MLKSKLPLIAGFVMFGTSCAFASGLVIVSIEQFSYQTSATTSSVAEYIAYADVEDVPGVTAASVRVNGGAINQLIEEDPGFFSARADFTAEQFTAFSSAYPVDGSYEFSITKGTNPPSTVTINGASGTFASNQTITPHITPSGVTGVWSTAIDGTGIFTFDFASVANATSFTLSLNPFSAANPGGYYGYYLNVEEAFNEVDEVGDGPLENSVTPTATTITFNLGAAPDNNDGDLFTYGITPGQEYYVEGGLFNVFDLEDSGLGDESNKAFVIGQSVGFVLRAAPIPEPTSTAALFGVVALGLTALRRRRRA